MTDVDPAAPASAEEQPEISLRMGEGKQLPKWFWRAIIAVALSVAAYQFSRSILVQLSGFLLIVAISLFLSFAVEPAVNHLSDRGWKRSVATLFCFVTLFVVGGVFLFVMGDLVVSQVTDLVEKAPEYLDDSSEWINDTFGTDITTDNVTEQIESYQDDLTDVARNVGGRVLAVTGALFGLIFQGFTIMLFSYYLTSQGPQFRRNVCSFLPERNQRTVLLLWELAIQKTGGWIYSRLVLAAVSSACTWVFLAIIGVPSPLALALWVGLISQFIPAIGTYLAGALPVLIALLNDPIDALWVLIFILVYQQVENYLLSPKITAQTMDLHPAVAFGSAIVGGTLLGPMGAIMALPAAGVVQAFVSTILQRHEVVDSHLTELEKIQAEQGDKGVRAAMKRIVRRGETDGDGRDDAGHPRGSPSVVLAERGPGGTVPVGTAAGQQELPERPQGAAPAVVPDQAGFVPEHLQRPDGGVALPQGQVEAGPDPQVAQQDPSVGVQGESGGVVDHEVPVGLHRGEAPREPVHRDRARPVRRVPPGRPVGGGRDVPGRPRPAAGRRNRPRTRRGPGPGPRPAAGPPASPGRGR